MRRVFINGWIVACLLSAWTQTAQANRDHLDPNRHRHGNAKVRGIVYLDINHNEARDWNEPGIPGVSVSNGKEVVRTDRKGAYELPAYEEMIVFITKPEGFKTPLNEHNIPKFYYLHQPNGSPDNIQEFPGVDPTGPLPRSVDFPLYRSQSTDEFSAVMIGDTQVYSDDEIGFLRDTLVKEISNGTDAAFALSMGDNIGDVLSLYPRYLSVMSGMNLPFYLVPGNHDLNFDAEDSAHSFETFKRYAGPTYYSFNYGKVHFVVLKSVVYPSPLYTSYKTYHGEISAEQMEWLANDLALVPEDHLIVLNMHIPIVSYQDRFATQHQVANRDELYALLEGRKALSLGGHTHTLEHYLPGDEEEGWGGATPISQIIVGATCGSWWTGDLDETGVPMAYQRDGAPRGYSLFEFDGNEFEDTYKATGKAEGRQMNISFATPSFDSWYAEMWAWLTEDPSTRPETPTLSINDLPDQGIVADTEIADTTMVVNVWNASAQSDVYCIFDDYASVVATHTKEIGDPYALRLEAYVFRYAAGFTLWADADYGIADPQPMESWLHTQSSPHVWSCNLPSDLEPGIHRVKVVTNDVHGRMYDDNKSFEIVRR